MELRLAFSDDDTGQGDMPLLVAAVDEYTIDNWGRLPDWYKEEVASYKNVREATVNVSDSEVRLLFSLPSLSSASLRPLVSTFLQAEDR